MGKTTTNKSINGKWDLTKMQSAVSCYFTSFRLDGFQSLTCFLNYYSVAVLGRHRINYLTIEKPSPLYQTKLH